MNRLPILFLLVAGSAFAHHGWGEYDAKQPIQLSGPILESGYEHPHGHLKLNAGNKTWTVVLAPPSRMENRGLSRAMLKPGTQAVVYGYPHRDKPDEMRAERITIDNKTTELR
jgi:hypothetical protein